MLPTPDGQPTSPRWIVAVGEEATNGTMAVCSPLPLCSGEGVVRLEWVPGEEEGRGVVKVRWDWGREGGAGYGVC